LISHGKSRSIVASAKTQILVRRLRDAWLKNKIVPATKPAIRKREVLAETIAKFPPCIIYWSRLMLSPIQQTSPRVKKQTWVQYAMLFVDNEFKWIGVIVYTLSLTINAWNNMPAKWRKS
jgi:hypothetical protein